jgi:catechol 2,3-dioxygenase-like lactoylglutathione lyase family enzyme
VEEPLVPGRGSLHHLELYVPDLERSVALWGWLLLELGYVLDNEWDDGCSFRLGATRLVFVQAPGGPSDGPIDRRRPGLNHLAFHVSSTDEVDRLTEQLREHDVRILYEDRHPHAGGEDHYAVFFEDPDGLKVELVAPSGWNATD